MLKLKITPLFVAVLAFASCGKKEADFTKIKAGMSPEQVIDLVGEPDLKQPMFDTEMWLYMKQDKSIEMRADTVAFITLELAKELEEVEKVWREAGEAMKQLQGDLQP